MVEGPLRKDPLGDEQSEEGWEGPLGGKSIGRGVRPFGEGLSIWGVPIGGRSIEGMFIGIQRGRVHWGGIHQGRGAMGNGPWGELH